MTSRDAIFDQRLTDALARDVYGTTKGAVRLRVLWEDLTTEVPELRSGGLRVIDVGAGMGQVAARIAQLGNDVTLCEPSAEMLDKARATLAEAGVEQRAHFVESSLQQLDLAALGEFDLVLCHAVLEWLAEPEAALRGLLPLLAPGGALSLLVYNRNAAVLKRVLEGNFDRALDLMGGTRRRLPTPLDAGAVHGWLEALGLHVQSKAGIRIFHDHLPEELRTRRLEALLEIETSFRKREPFASLAQHVHFVCRREDAGP